jgi:hypothetical protein
MTPVCPLPAKSPSCQHVPAVRRKKRQVASGSEAETIKGAKTTNSKTRAKIISSSPE